ncbi:MAG: hypothetical protein LBJ11_06525 [Oscillospiraceae bacterium]|nr:hypothetical protein [Oscillospiraceae bacterium]
MRKQAEVDGEKRGPADPGADGGAAKAAANTPTAAELRLIHRFTRRELRAEELYVFRVILCDNETDRDGERFETAGLPKLAELFVGKTGLFDHSGKSGDQVMRIYDTEVIAAPGRTTGAGEPYTAVRAKVYLPRGGTAEELIAQIDAGIKKEVSVGCAVGLAKCSVCGKPHGREGCRHQKGKVYDGAVCCRILCDPADAYEFSFVAVPAQPGAGVIKRRGQTEEAAERWASVRAEELEALRELAADGRRYRGELLRKARRAAGLALPQLPGGLAEQMCAGLTTEELARAAEAFESQAARGLPLRPQLAPQGEAQATGVAGFKFG